MSSLHNRGGKREGAGRPKREDQARRRIQIMLSPENLARLDLESAKRGLSKSELINRSLNRGIKGTK